jgi:hypothetical protein
LPRCALHDRGVAARRRLSRSHNLLWEVTFASGEFPNFAEKYAAVVDETAIEELYARWTGRQVGGRAEPGEGVAEAGAGQGGERRLREQKRLAGGMPDGAVIGQSAAGDEAVNVRVEDEPLRPGMQHGEHADGAADPAWIAGQHDDRRGGGLHQRAVAVDLMPAQRGPQFLGHGDGDVEIGNR